MKINVHRVRILRDPMTKVEKTVWAWESPILEFKFEGKVEILGKEEIEVESLPDAESEYARLCGVFGTEEGGNVYAHIVYGRGTTGLTALQKVIDGCVVKENKDSKKTVKKKASKKPKVVDPLAD